MKKTFAILLTVAMLAGLLVLPAAASTGPPLTSGSATTTATPAPAAKAQDVYTYLILPGQRKRIPPEQSLRIPENGVWIVMGELTIEGRLENDGLLMIYQEDESTEEMKKEYKKMGKTYHDGPISVAKGGALVNRGDVMVGNCRLEVNSGGHIHNSGYFMIVDESYPSQSGAVVRIKDGGKFTNSGSGNIVLAPGDRMLISTDGSGNLENIGKIVMEPGAKMQGNVTRNKPMWITEEYEDNLIEHLDKLLEDKEAAFEIILTQLFIEILELMDGLEL